MKVTAQELMENPKILWSDAKKEIYDQCVRTISETIDSSNGTFTSFDGSYALALCFNLPKELTIKDIHDFRDK